MSGPLHGVRVLDLTRVLSGPFCSLQLADLGASVIKVEQAGAGDLMRQLGGYQRGGFTAAFLSLNRGKRSIAVDLHHPEGQELVRELAAEVDVVIENFRPGSCAAMGLDAERLHTVNPDLIYASISGYGPDSPAAQEPAYDTIIQGRSGMVARQVDDLGGCPDLVRSFLVDKLAGMFAAQAVVAALFARARGTVRGQTITIPMFDAALYYLWPDVLSDLTLVGDGVRAGTLASAAVSPTPTRDGYVTYLALADKERAGVASAVGRPELMDDPRFADVAEFVKPGNYRAFSDVVARTCAQLSTTEVVARLRAADVPCSAVAQPADVLADPHVLGTDVLAEQEHPRAGRSRFARFPARFNATPTGAGEPAPRLGEHTEAVLADAGVAAERVEGLRARGAFGPGRSS